MQNNSSHTKLQPVLTTSSFLREPPVPVLTSVVQLFESIENHEVVMKVKPNINPVQVQKSQRIGDFSCMSQQLEMWLFDFFPFLRTAIMNLRNALDNCRGSVAGSSNYPTMVLTFKKVL